LAQFFLRHGVQSLERLNKRTATKDLTSHKLNYNCPSQMVPQYRRVVRRIE